MGKETYEWLRHLPLEEAAETGNVGAGESQRRYADGMIEICCAATPEVKYYYFSNGDLVLAGRGKTKSVDPGGNDGRNSYIPEQPPWSDQVILHAVKLIVTEGVTVIGAGLLSSLKMLKEINLADSVQSIEHNEMRGVTVFRAGTGLKQCRGHLGKLTGLELRNESTLFTTSSVGLPPVSSDQIAIRKKIDNGTQNHFGEQMELLFRDFSGVGSRMAQLGSFDTEFAARTLRQLDWNSPYKTSRHVPAADLRELMGIPAEQESGQPSRRGFWPLNLIARPKAKKKLRVDFSEAYASDYLLLAALVQTALEKHPAEIDCILGSRRLEQSVIQWWMRIFPDVKLTLVQVDGRTISTEFYGERYEPIRIDLSDCLSDPDAELTLELQDELQTLLWRSPAGSGSIPLPQNARNIWDPAALLCYIRGTLMRPGRPEPCDPFPKDDAFRMLKTFFRGRTFGPWVQVKPFVQDEMHKGEMLEFNAQKGMVQLCCLRDLQGGLIPAAVQIAYYNTEQTAVWQLDATRYAQLMPEQILERLTEDCPECMRSDFAAYEPLSHHPFLLRMINFDVA